MSLTVAQVEATVVNQVRGWMARCGLAVTTAGDNADLAVPIASALRGLGLPPADPTAPTDADLSTVPPAREELFLGIVRLEALRACLGRFDEVDETAGTDKMAFDQFARRLERAIEAAAKELLDQFGHGRRRGRQPAVGTLCAGSEWPPPPPPPLSSPPWPPGSRPGSGSGQFNP